MKSGLLRFMATSVAILSLAWIGWDAWRGSTDGGDETSAIVLLTLGAPATPSVPNAVRVALPEFSAPDKNIRRVPDVPYLRRAFPKLARVTIRGDGVDADTAEALRGLQIKWEKPSVTPETPMLDAYSAPTELLVGQELEVQGNVRGLRAGTTIPITLESPQGGTETLEIKAATDNSVPFSIHSGTAVAPGQFEWKLRIGNDRPPIVIGAAVRTPLLPRVLLLQASPNPETSRLQRWLAERGARMTARTRVSAEHFRFAAANESPAEFAAIDETLLKAFDVIVTSDAAITELAANERAAIDDAVKNRGVGVIVLGELTPRASTETLSPWTTLIGGQVTAEDDAQPARIRLASGTEMTDAVNTLPGGLPPVSLGRWLARDAAGRTLAAAVLRGRGQLARSTVIDSWRWLQEGHAETYASFWSFLLSTIAASQTSDESHWSLGDPAHPRALHEPIDLLWSGPTEQFGTEARASDADGGQQTLTLNSSVLLTRTDATTRPARVTATARYWPSNPGWQTITHGKSEATFAFYVPPPEAMAGERMAQRHRATAELVASSTNDTADWTTPATPAVSPNRTTAWAYIVFVGAAAFLWLQERRRIPVAGR